MRVSVSEVFLKGGKLNNQVDVCGGIFKGGGVGGLSEVIKKVKNRRNQGGGRHFYGFGPLSWWFYGGGVGTLEGRKSIILDLKRQARWYLVESVCFEGFLKSERKRFNSLYGRYFVGCGG